MRLFLISLFGGCLLGLMIGCDTSASNKVEKPTDIKQPPSKENILKGAKTGGAANAPAPMGTTVPPKKKK